MKKSLNWCNLYLLRRSCRVNIIQFRNLKSKALLHKMYLLLIKINLLIINHNLNNKSWISNCKIKAMKCKIELKEAKIIEYFSLFNSRRFKNFLNKNQARIFKNKKIVWTNQPIKLILIILEVALNYQIKKKWRNLILDGRKMSKITPISLIKWFLEEEKISFKAIIRTIILPLIFRIILLIISQLRIKRKIIFSLIHLVY